MELLFTVQTAVTAALQTGYDLRAAEAAGHDVNNDVIT